MKPITTVENLKAQILESLYMGKNVEQVINEVLRLVGDYFDVDRAYIFENTADGLVCNNTFEWCHDGITPEIDNLQGLTHHEDMGDLYPGVFDARGIFYCPDINTLPSNARDVLSAQHITGVLHCAILENGEFKGFIGFDNCAGDERPWMTDEASVETLIYTSRLLTIYLLEQRNKEHLRLRNEELATTSQRKLQRERDRYEHLLDAVPTGIATFDVVRGKSIDLLYFNDEITRMTGYSREEIEARGARKICEICPEDYDDIMTKVLKLVDTRTPGEVEYRTYTKTGELRYFRSKMVVEETENKRLILYITYIDITLEKEAHNAINSELQYLHSVQEKSLLAHCRVNLTKDILDNYTAEHSIPEVDEKVRYSTTVNLVAQQCATKEMRDEFIKKMSPKSILQVFKEGTKEFSFEYLRTMQDGNALWVKTKIKIFLNPTTQNVICFMYTYDINQEKTMQLIVEHITQVDFDMMGIINTTTGILRCLRISDVEQDMGCTRDIPYEISTPDFVQRYVVPELQAEVLKNHDLNFIKNELITKKVHTFSFPIRFKNKTYYKKWEFAYLDSTKNIIVFTRSDVTDLFKQQEEQRENLRTALLQAEEASKAKTNFLSRMSHEIRTPMNAIIGMTALATQVVNQPEQVVDCLGKIGISARFLLALINDILDMSRIESGKIIAKKEKFPFEELIHSINSIFCEQAADKGIDYDCVIATFTDEYYIGDYMKLQQVIVNLLSNAIKFTPTGGKVQFVVHQERIEKGKVYMCFAINDTGVGINPAFQKVMFEPFEQEDITITTPYKGTGLGLAIAKNLVTIMGGTIAVNSIEGVGTEFTVRVPLGQCENEEKYRSLKLEATLQKLATLIVDDDIAICQQTQALLEDLGLKAQWVMSGKAAVDVVRSKWQEKDAFDIILLDWKMPDMDGVETARAIRKIVGDDVTIIVMTAYDWTEIEMEARQAGINMFVAKPLFKSSLISVFSKAFRENKAAHTELVKREYDFKGKNILLVEDHIINVEVAKRLLQSKNAYVDVAENGLRAIEMFMAAKDNFYDAILMDIRMPVMDGLTATRSLRQLHKLGAKNIPIIAMSANAFDEDVEKSREAGMNEHLSKPIEPNVLYSVLAKYFEGEGNT